jgi:hypothetical protein
MRVAGVWLLIGSSCVLGCVVKSSTDGTAPPPLDPIEAPLNPDATTDAPEAGARPDCPDGTEARAETANAGEILRSCVVPGRDYRNTPFRHGPYQLVGPNNKLRMAGQWRDNKEDGLWRWWHPNGKLRRQMTYQLGQNMADASWDDTGRPQYRSDRSGATTWYPNGNKSQETKVADDGVLDATYWYESGSVSKRERSRNGQRESVTEYWENGKKREEWALSGAKVITWQGWSSNGMELKGSKCVEDADCVAGVKNVCYGCAPPYEPLTRWEAADRRIHPPTPPTGCDPGPFACMALPTPPAAYCRTGKCTLTP